MQIRINATETDFSPLEKIAFFLYFLVEVNIELFVNRPLYVFSAVLLSGALVGSGKARIGITKYHVWTFLWALVVAVSITYSIDPSVSFTAVLILLARAMVFFAILARVHNYSLLRKMLEILVFTEFINILYILSRINILMGIQRIGFRSIETDSDASWNSNAISSDVALCMMCLGGLLYNKKTRHRTISFLILILFAAVGILCGSRMGILLIIGTPVLLLFLSSDKTNKLKRFSALILFLALTYYCIFEIPVIYDILGVRVERLIDTLAGRKVIDKSISERNSLITYGMKWFMEKPVFGYGMYTFRVKIGTVMYGKNLYAHNNFVEILFGAGIVGFIAYYWLYLYMFFKAYMNRNKYRHWAIVAAGILIILAAEYATVSFKKFAFQFAIVLLFMILNIDHHEYMSPKS